MIDGSHHVFEENIEITKSVVRACHAAGIPVEAELGKVGGKEDDLDGGNGNGYTVPSEAAEFAERTGVDSLAVAIGTAHGVYKGTPKLDMERLSEIRKVVSVPLVLHGTSGVPDDAVRECVARGMCKVNYATDLRIAFSKGLKEYLAKDPEVFDPKKYSAVGREYLWHLKNISQGSVRSHRPQVRQVQIGRNSADILEEIENGLAQLLRCIGPLELCLFHHILTVDGGAAVGGAEPGDPKDRRSGGDPQLGGHLIVRLVIGSPDKGHAGSVSALANHIQKLHFNVHSGRCTQHMTVDNGANSMTLL